MTVSEVGYVSQPYKFYGTGYPPVQKFTQQDSIFIPNNKVQNKNSKKELSIGAKLAIGTLAAAALVMVDYVIRGKVFGSKKIMAKIEKLLNNEKLVQKCKEKNICTDVNKIREKSKDEQINFLTDLLDIFITIA